MINVLQINIDRRRAAQDLIDQTSIRVNSDIIIVSEPNKSRVKNTSWYRDKNDDVCIIKKNRSMNINSWGRGRGYVWIESGKVFIFGVYISPNVDLTVFADWLSELARDIRRRPGKIVVAGDFNAKSPLWGSPAEDKRGALVGDWAASLNLSVLNTGEPTFERGSTKTHIDLTWASEDLISKVTGWSVLEEESLSLHNYIKFGVEVKSKTRQSTWKRRGLDTITFRQIISKDSIIKNGHADLGHYLRVIQEANNAAIVWERTDHRGNSVYWWTDEIEAQRKEMVKTRRLLQRLRARNNIEAHVVGLVQEEYKTQRKKMSKTIRREKALRWSTLCSELESDIWGAGYQIVTRTLQISPPKIDLDNDKRLQIVNVLFPMTERRPWPPPSVAPAATPFSSAELNAAVSRLKVKKAPGPDGMRVEALKIINDTYHCTLLHMLNRLYIQAKFWKGWKAAKVILIPKPGKPQEAPNDFRPICLLNAFAKLFETLILSRLNEEILRTGDISISQYGFRKGRSTIGAIQHIVSRINRLGPNAWGTLILFDVRNAFNTADWDIILGKLVRRGCDRHLVNVVKDFFTDRKLLVSNKVERGVSMGVPQGSILGPALWNILFDDVLSIFNDPDVQAVAYADDLAVIVNSRTKADLISKTNSTLSKVDEWMRNNKLTLAVEKTDCVVFCGMRRPKDVRFKLRNSNIEPKTEVKYLGVFIDRLLTFGKHIFYAAEKAERTAAALGRLLPNIGGPPSSKRKTLAQAVMSVLLYAAPVWATALRVARYKTRLLSVQRKMVLRIASAYRTVSTDAALVIAGEIPVHILADERRRIDSATGDKAAIAREERRISLACWQDEFSASQKGAWTRRLISDVAAWHKRGFGEINYFSTQALTGHGNFRTFLHAIGKVETEECIYCGSQDTPEHAIFACPREDEQRRRVELQIGVTIHPENLIASALRNKWAWSVIFGFLEKLMRRRETDFRERELNP